MSTAVQASMASVRQQHTVSASPGAAAPQRGYTITSLRAAARPGFRRPCRRPVVVQARVSPPPGGGRKQGTGGLGSMDEERDGGSRREGDKWRAEEPPREQTEAEVEAELRQVIREQALEAARQEEQQRRQVASHSTAYRTFPWMPAFTRRRERLVGKVAALGMAGTILGEVMTGLGPIHQLAAETGIGPDWWARAFAAAAVGGLMFGIMPGSSTWARPNQEDVRKRGFPPASVGGSTVSSRSTRTFLGQGLPSLAWLGLNSKNELLLGRLAMLLFAGELVMEGIVTGYQGLFTGLGVVPAGGSGLDDAPLWLLGLAVAMLVAALGRKTLED